MQDIAIVTGAEYIAKDLGMKFEDTVLEQLGSARKITVAPTSTTIIAEAGSQEEIAMRVAQIKKELERSDSVYDIEKLSERIAKLTGGIAVIKVRRMAADQSPIQPWLEPCNCGLISHFALGLPIFLLLVDHLLFS